MREQREEGMMQRRVVKGVAKGNVEMRGGRRKVK